MYHWRDWWYFRRDGNSGVVISNQDADTVLRISVDEWASIVAAMSYDGENYDTFSEARSFFLRGMKNDRKMQ